MGKLTIQELANILVEKNGLNIVAANDFATEFFAIILQRLQQGDQVKVKGLGTFKITSVEARESVSVRTGERVVIDSHSKVTFIPDTVMKELVNKPFSQFETVVLNEGVEFDDMKDDDTETENEKAVEETPVVEELPVAEETPVVEKLVDEQPVVEETAEEESLLDHDEEEEEEEEGKPWGRWLLSLLGILILMALSAWGGYQYGARRLVAAADTVIVKDTVFMAEEDTANLAVAQQAEEVTPQPEAKEEPKTVVKEEPKAKPAETLDKWSAKDERVRLGAYRIVGTAEEVTVLPGQTFYSICRAHLGPDMQCYVEAYNDLPNNPKIKEGQVIKIPKLELKKRRK